MRLFDFRDRGRCQLPHYPYNIPPHWHRLGKLWTSSKRDKNKREELIKVWLGKETMHMRKGDTFPSSLNCRRLILKGVEFVTLNKCF